MSHIIIIEGHPDAKPGHFCHALADAYAAGAEAGGHGVRRAVVATMDFPLLRSREDWEAGAPPPAIRQAQDDIGWADHLLIIYPLWLGGMPALLRGFFEQAFRPGFATGRGAKGMGQKLLTGKSARIVVTMGMPAFVYRWYFGAHSLKSLERNMLKFCGIGPIRETLFGRVEAGGPRRHAKILERLRALGREAR